MNRRQLLKAFIAMSCAFALPSYADENQSIPIEINYLLNFIGKSECAFYRNGSWYEPQKAQQHLQNKYGRSDGIRTADEFIDQLASVSSFTGESYKVRCNDGVTLLASVWLHSELMRYRKRGKK